MAAGCKSLLPAMLESESGGLSLALIKRAAQAGDQVALESLAEVGAAIGSGMASLVNIFNPEKIVLGGPVSAAGEYLMPGIREGVRLHALSEVAGQTDICVSAFGPDASLIGAAAVVIDDILGKPTEVAKEVMPGVALNMVVA